MHSPSQKSRRRQPTRLDSVMRGRILNGCWLSAAVGSSIVQMQLLAQAWHQEQHATRTACIASAWLLGTLIGGVVNHTLRRRPARPALVWGTALLGSAVGWRIWTPPIGYAGTSSLMPDLVARILPLLAAALLLGLLSSLWLGQPRSWASVGERATLVRSAVCLMVGLVMVWCYPSWSELVGLTCLLPLLVLDLLSMALTPRPGLGGMTGTLLEPGADPACWSTLRLERRARVSGWWRAYLVHRGQAVPTLLAIGTAILLGAVWNAVPTPLAAELAAAGETNTLTWLLAGQVGALAVGMWLLKRSRGLLGAPDRLVPRPLRTHAWRLAWLCLAGVSCSLVLLGLPFLQDPWWLALSLFTCTLAATAWGVLLPRLRPSITAEVEASRHLAFGGGRVIKSGSLAYEQALENQVRLILRTGEGVMTAVCTPLVGFLIDSLTGERTLILMGVVLAWFLGIVMVTSPAEMTDQLSAQPVSHTTWCLYDLPTREAHMRWTSRQKKPPRRP